MQLLVSRDYAMIDYQTMGEFVGYERLFRATDGTFLLHMSSEGKLEAEVRIIWLTVRDAISWLMTRRTSSVLFGSARWMLLLGRNKFKT
jgi:hypothetical protein